MESAWDPANVWPRCGINLSTADHLPILLKGRSGVVFLNQNTIDIHIMFVISSSSVLVV